MKRIDSEINASFIPADPAAVVVVLRGDHKTLTVDEAINLRAALYDAISAANAENVEHGHANNVRKYWWHGWKRR